MEVLLVGETVAGGAVAFDAEVEAVALLRVELRRNIADRIIDVLFAVDVDREGEVVRAQLQLGVVRDDNATRPAIEGRSAIGLASETGRLQGGAPVLAVMAVAGSIFGITGESPVADQGRFHSASTRDRGYTPIQSSLLR